MAVTWGQHPHRQTDRQFHFIILDAPSLQSTLYTVWGSRLTIGPGSLHMNMTKRISYFFFLKLSFLFELSPFFGFRSFLDIKVITIHKTIHVSNYRYKLQEDIVYSLIVLTELIKWRTRCIIVYNRCPL